MPDLTPRYVQHVLEYRAAHTYPETLAHFQVGSKGFASAVLKALYFCYEPASSAPLDRVTFPPNWDAVRIREDAPDFLLKHICTPGAYRALFHMPQEFVAEAYRASLAGASLPQGIYRHADNLAELALCALDEEFSPFRSQEREDKVALLRQRFSDPPALRVFVRARRLEDVYPAVPDSYGKSSLGLLLLADAYHARLREEPRMFDTSQERHLRWWEFPEEGKLSGVHDDARAELIYHVLETVFTHDVPGYKEAAYLRSALERRAAEINVVQAFVIDGDYRADTTLFFKRHGIRFLLDPSSGVRHNSSRAILEVWDSVKSDLLHVPSYFTDGTGDLPALKMRTAKGRHTGKMLLDRVAK
ncbi:hypothetical protein HZC31_07820 [Candidatus Woesearchaeota archaeon]|nr:hypothetical protein [Candidatus Woesearchaeota archaeon]